MLARPSSLKEDPPRGELGLRCLHLLESSATEGGSYVALVESNCQSGSFLGHFE